MDLLQTSGTLLHGAVGMRERADENLRVSAVVIRTPGVARVNGVVTNMPQFGPAFSCKAGQPMVKPKFARSGSR